MKMKRKRKKHGRKGDKDIKRRRGRNEVMKQTKVLGWRNRRITKREE